MRRGRLFFEGRVWPELFLEAVALKVALVAAQGGGALAAAPALVTVFQRSPFLRSARKLAASLWEQHRPPNGIRTREALCDAFQHSIDESGNGGNDSNGAPAKSMPSTKKNHNGEMQAGGTTSNGGLIESFETVERTLVPPSPKEIVEFDCNGSAEYKGWYGLGVEKTGPCTEVY